MTLPTRKRAFSHTKIENSLERKLFKTRKQLVSIRINYSLSLRRKIISETGLVRIEGLPFLEGTERITERTRPSLLNLTSETRAMGQLLRLRFLSFMMTVSPGVRDRWIWVHLGLGWRE